jgi:hypothetical protein
MTTKGKIGVLVVLLGVLGWAGFQAHGALVTARAIDAAYARLDQLYDSAVRAFPDRFLGDVDSTRLKQWFVERAEQETWARERRQRSERVAQVLSLGGWGPTHTFGVSGWYCTTLEAFAQLARYRVKAIGQCITDGGVLWPVAVVDATPGGDIVQVQMLIVRGSDPATGIPRVVGMGRTLWTAFTSLVP